MTYISWFSGLYLEDFFMYKAVTLAGGIGEPLLTYSSFVILFEFSAVFVKKIVRHFIFGRGKPVSAQ